MKGVGLEKKRIEEDIVKFKEKQSGTLTFLQSRKSLCTPDLELLDFVLILKKSSL